jgi:hypothetical protein
MNEAAEKINNNIMNEAAEKINNNMKFNELIKNILAESNKDLYTEDMKNNTQEVRTYEWSGEDGNGMIPVSNGEWVYVDDYKSLLDAYNIAKKEIVHLEKMLYDEKRRAYKAY